MTGTPQSFKLESMKRLRTMKTRLLRKVGEAAAQEERNRLARDLHDSIKQQLFTINISTAAAQERLERDPDGARAALADVRRSAREAMVAMQALLHQLRPQALSSTAGLIGALREQCEALGYRTGAQVSLEIGPEIPDDRMPAGGVEALFRMVQETLANVARHARARTIWLRIGREEDAVLLRIADDGQGFEPGAVTAGMGLRNLRERAEALGGTVSIISASGAGTRIAIQVPLSPSRPTPTLRRDFGELAWDLGLLSLFMLSLRVPTLDNQLLEGIILILVLLLVAFFSWWFLRQNSGPYAQHRRNTIVSLCMGWALWIQFQDEDKAPPWILFVYTLTFVTWVGLYLVRFHRVSEVRRFWRVGERIWLGLLGVAVIEVVAILSLAALDFGLVLKPLEVLRYLISLAVFAYVISRQPRTAGDLA